MQILSLKTPFMGVQAIEKIEIRRFLLLIGEQASGKSTLAKLIYFFQKVPEYIYESVVRTMNKNQPFDPNIQIGYELRDRFYETFGILSQKELNICFYYLDKDEAILDVHIEIYKKEDNKIYVKFSEQLRIWTYRSVHNALVSNQNLIEINERNKTNGFLSIEKSHLQETLRNNLNDHFSNENTDFTYLIAGRSSTVAFPEMIEAKLEAELENVIENAIKKQNFGKRIGNERLFLQFINWARELRSFFKNNGGGFEAAKEVLIHHESLDKLIAIFERILKGKYDYQNGEEAIRINANEKVGLKDASSGQQEVLRILQGIFIATGTENRIEMMIVEEPEAHLFPLAQREIINAFALFLNTITEGKLIITTHSPYILACVNILLMANYVAKHKTQQAEMIDTKIIDKDFWLNAEDFSAYSLGHEAPYCVNLKDDVTGFIAQNYLDSISDALGMQYQQLYHLLTR